MYMPARYVHDDWQDTKSAKLTKWEEQKEERAIPKWKEPAEPPVKPSTRKGNLRLSNSFKSALATKMMTSDREAEVFINKIIKAALDDASNDDSSKE